MAIPSKPSHEQEVSSFIQDMADIFFSEEFNSLRQELEKIYYEAKEENPFLAAFKDALFAILAQNEKAFNYPRLYGK